MSGSWKSCKSPSYRWRNKERILITRRKGTGTLRKTATVAQHNVLGINVESLPRAREGSLNIAPSRGSDGYECLFTSCHAALNDLGVLSLSVGSPIDALGCLDVRLEVFASLHRIKRSCARVCSLLRSLDDSLQDNEELAMSLIVFKAKLLRKRTTNIDRNEGLEDVDPIDVVEREVQRALVQLSDSALFALCASRHITDAALADDAGEAKTTTGVSCIHHLRFTKFLCCKVLLVDALHRILEYCHCCAASTGHNDAPGDVGRARGGGGGAAPSPPFSSRASSMRSLVLAKQSLVHVPKARLDLFSSYDYQYFLVFAIATSVQKHVHLVIDRHRAARPSSSSSSPSPSSSRGPLRRTSSIPRGLSLLNEQSHLVFDLVSTCRRLALRRADLSAQSRLLSSIFEMRAAAGRFRRASRGALIGRKGGVWLPSSAEADAADGDGSSPSTTTTTTTSSMKDEDVDVDDDHQWWSAKLTDVGVEFLSHVSRVVGAVTDMRDQDTKDFASRQTVRSVGQRYTEDVVLRNIWREPTMEDENVVYVEDEDGASYGGGGGLRRIKAATVNQLVLRLTNESHHDIEFLKAFITTFRSFTTPDVLFEKLIQRYQVPLWTKGRLTDESWMTTIVMPIRIRVISVITMWLRSRFSDFDYALAMKLSKFCDKLIEDGHPKLATQVSRCISRCARLAKSQGALQRRPTSANIVVGGGRSSLLASTGSSRIASVHEGINSGAWLLDMDPHRVAEHIAMREFELYRAIQPVELLNQAWNKPKYKHRSPNVCEVIRNFNKMAGWVVVSVMHQKGLRQRARLLTKFMQICTALFDMNDFNGANALLAGCSNHCIARMKHTLEDVPSKAKDGLQRVSSYLMGEKSAAYTNLLNSVAPPVLPYLGYYLSELTFIEESSSDEISGLINFTKRERIYSVISEIHKWQQTAYTFEESVTVRGLLDAIRVEDDEDQWWDMSIKLEPRDVPKSHLEQ